MEEDIVAKNVSEASFAIAEDAFFSNQLRLLQPQKGHKAGTDAVLLAAALPSYVRKIADFGASTGVVGLRAAQLNPEAQVILVEQEEAMLILAQQNIHINNLQDRVKILAANVFNLSKQQEFWNYYDIILTNPPYFKANEVSPSPQGLRARAHVLAGSLEDWVKNAVALLQAHGEFVMIHRADVLGEALAACHTRLGRVRLRFIHSRADHAANRFILWAKKGSKAPLSVLPPLILHDSCGVFTSEAAALHAGQARLWADEVK